MSAGIVTLPIGEERCATCRYLKKPENVCRRFPPQVELLKWSGEGDGRLFETFCFFPTMIPEAGWCGEWTPVR